jgi:hypothetical protein
LSRYPPALRVRSGGRGSAERPLGENEQSAARHTATFFQWNTLSPKVHPRLLARRADGIHLAPFEQGEIGPALFKAACDLMLEGLVSKRRDSRYRAGPSRDWIKVKNPKFPAMNRAKDAFS